MKRIASILVIGVCILAAPCVSRAQDDGAKKEATDAEQTAQLPAAKLSDEDKQLFGKLLTEYVNEDDRDKQAEALDVLLKSMDDYSEKNKVASPVSDDKAWIDIFGSYNEATYAKKKVYGAGRIKTEMLTMRQQSDYVAYEYSVFVPKSYDPKKSWPVLVALHDKGAKNLGKGYIEKIWLKSSKESKALCENFIIVAPHIGEKLPKKKIKVKEGGKNVRRETVPQRVSWFSGHHLKGIILPLVEVRKAYNCDPNRIFIEGVGEGADMAATLGAVSCGRFAGVISRHGKLREPRLLTGLQHTPALFMARESSPFMKGSGKEFIDLVKAAQNGETKYDSLDLEMFQGDGRKLSLKLLAGQATDPILEANGKVAEFIAEKVLNPYPEEIRITSNSTVFKQHMLLRVTEHGIAEGKVLDCIARFDREKNTVELTGENFFRVSLFLNDSVLDLSKPVQILVNGRTVDARVPDRSASRLVKGFANAPYEYHLVLPCLIRVPRFSLDVEDKKGEEGSKEGEESSK